MRTMFNAQLMLFVRYCDVPNREFVEDVSGMANFCKQTLRGDIYNKILEMLNEKGIDMNKVVSV